MDYFQLIFGGIFVLVAGSFVLARLKYGSWTGAFLKGSIEQTYGQVTLSGGVASSQVMKVVQLRDGEGQDVRDDPGDYVIVALRPTDVQCQTPL